MSTKDNKVNNYEQWKQNQPKEQPLKEGEVRIPSGEIVDIKKEFEV